MKTPPLYLRNKNLCPLHRRIGGPRDIRFILEKGNSAFPAGIHTPDGPACKLFAMQITLSRLLMVAKAFLQ